MKVFFNLLIFFIVPCFQLTSCGYPETPMAKLKGMNDANDVVFIYKKGITYEQKEDFQNNVIYKSRADGRGRDHAPEVIDVMLGRIMGDYEGGVVNFSESATTEQRETLKRAIKESSIVYKVYENAVPDEIKDL